jgi:hypothetical protein
MDKSDQLASPVIYLGNGRREIHSPFEFKQRHPVPPPLHIVDGNLAPSPVARLEGEKEGHHEGVPQKHAPPPLPHPHLPLRAQQQPPPTRSCGLFGCVRAGAVRAWLCVAWVQGALGMLAILYVSAIWGPVLVQKYNQFMEPIQDRPTLDPQVEILRDAPRGTRPCAVLLLEHGIEGRSRTWYYANETLGEGAWPAIEMGNHSSCTRVIAINYAAIAFTPASTYSPPSLEIQSSQILHLLLKHDVGKLPLYVWCHSMGGLMLLEIVIAAFKRWAAKQVIGNHGDLARSLKGALFFGTPFIGSAWADTLKGYKFVNQNVAELSAYHPRVHTRLDEWWAIQDEVKFKVMCVAETSDTLGMGVIVDSNSAHFACRHGRGVAQVNVGNHFEVHSNEMARSLAWEWFDSLVGPKPLAAN